jgi:hypothetical protein
MNIGPDASIVSRAKRRAPEIGGPYDGGNGPYRRDRAARRGTFYYRSIFNPARLMKRAMLKEMPKARGELKADERRSCLLNGSMAVNR